MRITFVAPAANRSGGIRVIALHADHLRARGHQVTVVAPRPSKPGLRAYLRGLRSRSWPEYPPGSFFDTMEAELRLFEHGGGATDADVPDGDAVIATWWDTAHAVAGLSARKGRKFHFVQGHEIWPPIPAERAAAAYRLPLRRIVVSPALAEIMRETYGDATCRIVPNGVDRVLFNVPARGRQPVPRVGFVYSPATIKGADVARKAIAHARAKLAELEVLSFGATAPLSSSLLPTGAQFHLRPAQDRLPELYAACDVWLMASRSEGFGLPVLEAMACRCPVVSTRTGCVPVVIRNGVNGYAVDIDDAEALGQALCAVLDAAPDRWRAMSQAAHDTAARHDWETSTALFEQALMQP